MSTDTTEIDYDAIQALIHEHGPSEAQRILRRERRAARAREEAQSKRGTHAHGPHRQDAVQL